MHALAHSLSLSLSLSHFIHSKFSGEDWTGVEGLARGTVGRQGWSWKQLASSRRDVMVVSTQAGMKGKESSGWI